MFNEKQMSNTKPYRSVPELVRLICLTGDGTIVGSAAKYIVDGDFNSPTPRDWDIIVPYQSWSSVALILHQSARMNLNSFGGIHAKWEVNGVTMELDVWPSTLEEYLNSGKPSAILYKPRGGKVLRVEQI